MFASTKLIPVVLRCLTAADDAPLPLLVPTGFAQNAFAPRYGRDRHAVRAETYLNRACTTSIHMSRRNVPFPTVIASVIHAFAQITNPQRPLSQGRTRLAPHGKTN